MRDYCQHGEPMDEHCPQCNTKAAANDSATAPVPAGGTPEGLAREKVEMTDSEVKPSSPTTEAGRALLAIIYGEDIWRDDLILAIEQQARDEGRQEAVREIRDAARADACTTLTEDWCADEDHIDRLHAALRVAGLNASESPLLLGQVRVRGWDRFWGRLEQGFTASEQADHEGHRILVNGHGNRWCHDCEAWVYYNPAGDASESPPTTEEGPYGPVRPFHDPAPLRFGRDYSLDDVKRVVGDASESGHE